MDITAIYCNIDDFIKNGFNIQSIRSLPSKSCPGPTCRMSLSEISSILIAYHQSCFRHFKGFYQYLLRHYKYLFPSLVSYNRFIELTPRAYIVLVLYLESIKGNCTGISFVDSTPISVCKNIRINRNKVFKGAAKRGKCSMGWFYGFKLHIVVNEHGQLLAFKLTCGNKHDTSVLDHLTKNLFGKLFGDKGYISKAWFERLWENNIQLITNIRSNMKNKLIPLVDKLLLRKRFIIETVNDQLKNISDLEHSRHRSPANFIINVICSLISYQLKPKKPKIKWYYRNTLNQSPIIF